MDDRETHGQRRSRLPMDIRPPRYVLGHQISATSTHPPLMVFQKCTLRNIPVLQSTLLPTFPDRPAATTNRMSQAKGRSGRVGRPAQETLTIDAMRSLDQVE